MKKFQLISAIISIGLLLLVIIVSNQMKALKKEPKKKTPELPRVLVDVVEVQPELINMTVMSQGTVEPKIKSSIVTEVSGKIIKVSDKFVNGGFFNKGDMLFVIDSDNYRAEVMSAEARLAQAEALYRQEKARSAQAKKDWQKIGKGQPNELVLRIPQLQQAEADVKSAKAALNRSRRNFGKTKIVADFDGIIKQKNVDLGQYVTQGTRVAEVWGTDFAEIRLPITDAELAYMRLPSIQPDGFKPKVKFTQSVSGKTINWFGEISRTEGVIDLQNRVTYLVAEIEDPYRLKTKNTSAPLFYGTFVSAEIEGNEMDNIYSIPKQAIDQQQRVQLLTNESVMKIQPVEIARITQDRIYVSAGLNPGDLVITTALDGALNGTKVTRTGEITTKNSNLSISTENNNNSEANSEADSIVKDTTNETLKVTNSSQSKQAATANK